jgi:hypothetical protein
MRIRMPVAALIAIVALAGCDAAGPVPAPTTTLTSSPTPVALTAPHSVLNLPCESMDYASVEAVIGNRVTEVRDLELGPIQRIDQVLELQIGMQRCFWGDGDVFAVGFGVIPDAADAYAARSGWFDVVNEQYIRRDALGDRSIHACSYGYCFADILVGEHWVTVHASRPDLPDELDSEPVFIPFAHHVIDLVRAAEGGERDPWLIADDAFRPVPGWCDEPLVSQLAAVLDVPTLYTTGGDGYNGSTFEVWDRSGVLHCSLAADNAERPGYGYLEAVPGALWALPELAAVPSARYGEFQRVDAEGFEGDVFVAANATGASALVGLGGGVLLFSYDGFDRAGLLALLPRVVEAVRANPAQAG